MGHFCCLACIPSHKTDCAAGFHFNFPLGLGTNYDIWQQQQERLPPLLFRPRSDREPTPDLQRAVFEPSTVPLVLVAEWAENYGAQAGSNRFVLAEQ